MEKQCKQYFNFWTNADMVSLGEVVQKCNFLNGFPFQNNKFSLVYHSHVLEHFAKEYGKCFLKECFRILQKVGILRIALPDLEKIVKLYVEQLNNWNDENAKQKYKWIMLEMYDQTVRNKSGGEMFQYLKNITSENKGFIESRIGKSAFDYFNVTERPKRTIKQKVNKIINQPSLLFEKFSNLYFRLVLWGKHYNYYKLGAFRNGGEIHQWMYDQYSLTDVLKEIGFKEVRVQTATTSFITNWASYNLDDPNETASLFIEAIK